MIKEARSLQMKVMMGSMNESSIGSAAIANFLPQLDYVDMDGPLLLTKDLATGLTINPLNVELKGQVGLGIIPMLQ
jgi:L-alanine-DL-glutamate epimerase-like enolase superfamily enzyme